MDFYALRIKNARRHLEAGDHPQAEESYRLAIEQNKNAPEALLGLGLCLAKRGCMKAAKPYFSKAANSLLKAAKQTGDFSAALDLAFQLNHLHATEMALVLTEKVLIHQKNLARAHHIYALCLQKLSKTEAAYRSAKRAVQLAPEETNAAILLANLESRKGDPATAKQRLAAIVGRGVASDLPRAYLELGQVLDRLGDYEEAFACFVEAGRLRQNSPAVKKIDKASVYRDVHADKQALSTKTRSYHFSPRSVSDRPTPVFLIGFYRSGTTLMEQILAAHPQVVGSDEAPILPILLRELLRESDGVRSVPEQIATLDEQHLEKLRRDYWRMAGEMVAQPLDGKVLVDKTALNTLNLGLIDALFPGATVLFAVRDPRDVCLSCFMQSFGLSALTVHFSDWKETARFYALVLDYWISVRDRLDLDWLEVRYEDVIGGFEGQFRPILKKLGLDWQDQCREYYLQAQKRTLRTPSFDQVTRPIYHSSAGRWRNYSKQILEILPEIEKYIRIFGYEIESV